MRITNLVFLFLIVIASCGKEDREGANDCKSIAFITTPVQSKSLLVTPELKCYPAEQRLELNLNVKSLIDKRIVIREVVLNNPNGVNTSDEMIASKTLNIDGNKDTTLLITFNHINDKFLFHATGLPGLIDSIYQVSVFYSVEGKEGVRVINLAYRMPKERFLSYKKLYSTPVHIYYLNPRDGFDEKQREFLKTSLMNKTPPFVHVTEQEVGLSGLNFRFRCFHKSDSLYAEIFAVNHSDMTIRMDTAEMNITIDDLEDAYSHRKLISSKVTGSNAEADILRKGDRVVVTMKRYVRDHPERLRLALTKSFFLSNGNPLFNDNLELIRFSERPGSN
jgi:hypothetical protein